MSAQERPDTGARKPYQRHRRGKSGLVGNFDTKGEPIEPSFLWKKFVATAPAEARINWDDKEYVELKPGHKRTRSQMLNDNSGPSEAPKVTTEKEKPESVKSLAGSISEIFSPNLDKVRTGWESGDFLWETNHLFDRTLAVYGKFRETTLEKYHGVFWCTEVADQIKRMAKHHDALYDGPDGVHAGMLEKFENNDALYKKAGGIRQKVDGFYGKLRTGFNGFVDAILAFNEEQPVISTVEDVKEKFKFAVAFVAELDKREDELLTFKDAFKEFLAEVATLNGEPETKRARMEDHNNPSTEEWSGRPGPDAGPAGNASS